MATEEHNMLDRFPVASHCVTSSEGVNIIHVCYQDKSGHIKQKFFNFKSLRWEKSPNGKVGKANLNHGFAITGWAGWNEERVYYIEDNKIVERCRSPGKVAWYNGDIPEYFTVGDYSNLAVMSYENNDNHGTRCIRIIYQSATNAICMLGKDGDSAWSRVHTFNGGFPGTNIVCSYVTDRTGPRFFFFQRPDTTFVEYRWADSKKYWEEGAFKAQLVHDPCADIAVTSYANDNHHVSHRLFTIDSTNMICLTESRGQTSYIEDTIVSSALVRIVVPGSTEFRDYLQLDRGPPPMYTPSA